MEWPYPTGEATIGFKADRVYFRNEPLADTGSPASIACINVPATDWNNVVYELVPDSKFKLCAPVPASGSYI